MQNLPKKNNKLSSYTADLQSGSRPKGGVRDILSGVPSVGGEHLNKFGGFDFSSVRYVSKDFADSMTKGKIQDDDILIVKDGATTGKVSYVDSNFPYDYATVNEHVFILRSNKKIIPKLLFWFLWSEQGQREILNNFQGSAQGGINRSFLEGVDIPELPDDIQENLLKKLDSSIPQIWLEKARLEKTKSGIKKFRQAILTAAVTGKLTEDWRGENGVYEWENTILEKVIKEKPRNGYSPRPVSYPTPVKSLTLSATTSGYFKPEHYKYIDEKISKDSHLWLKNGDILIQRSNSYELVGVSAIYEGKDNEFIYPDLMMKVRPNNLTSNKFIYYLLSSLKTRAYFRQNATGTSGNMPKINQTIVLNTPVLLPKLEEQHEIERRIEKYFEIARRTEEQIETAEKKISKLTQAILAKTFRQDEL